MYYCRITRTLTETGNAIRKILTRNGFPLTHSISPPIYGASMASLCRNCDARKFIREITFKGTSQDVVNEVNDVHAHFSIVKWTLNRVKILCGKHSLRWQFYDILLDKIFLLERILWLQEARKEYLFIWRHFWKHSSCLNEARRL